MNKVKYVIFILLCINSKIIAQQNADSLMNAASEAIFFDSDYNHASSLLEECIQLYTEEIGPYSSKTLDAYYELANAYYHIGKQSEAANCYAKFAFHTNKSPIEAGIRAINIYENSGLNEAADSLYTYLHTWHEKQPSWVIDMRQVYVMQTKKLRKEGKWTDAIDIEKLQINLFDLKGIKRHIHRTAVICELVSDSEFIGDTKPIMQYGEELAKEFEEIPVESRAKNLTAASLFAPVAQYYTITGQYALANKAWLIGLKIRRSPDQMTIIHNNYAIFIANIGNIEQAFALLDESIKSFLEFNMYYDAAKAAYSMGAFASKINNQERYQYAYNLILKLAEEVQNNNDYPDAVRIELEGELASYYIDRQEYYKALPILEKALSYYLKHNRPKLTTVVLNNLAVCKGNLGQYAEAIELLSYAETFFDINSYPGIFLDVKSNKGRILARSGKTAEAVAEYEKVLARLREVMASGFVYMTEPERQEFWSTQNYIFDNIHNIGDNSPAVATLRFDAALANKGILLDSSLRLRALIEKSSDAELRAYFYRLSEQMSTNPHSEEATAMMRELQQRVAEIGDYTAGADTRTYDICRMLRTDECAVEIVRRVGADHQYAYDALIADSKGHVTVVPLPSQAAIDAACDIYTDPTALADAFWQPILAHAADKRTIYIAPDGAYHAIAFEYLPQGDAPIAQQRRIVRLSSTRQLSALHGLERPSSIALWGGLDYNSETDNDTDYSADRSRGLRLDDGVAPWQYLPGTRREVNDVYAMAEEKGLSCTVYTAEDGAEDSFKTISGQAPEMLHMATHGFFIPLPAEAMPGNDMLNSGLILAGANNSWLGGATVRDYSNDGILTSAEIARLDLSGTQLVVLSACQSGLGDISPEGVFGLPRAFKKSGAGSIVMTLWPVDDTATQHIMTAFYRHIFSGSAPRPALAAAVADTGYTDPALWAAFVIMD